MTLIKFLNLFLKISFLFLLLIKLNSCGIYRPVSAKDYPPEPEKRVQKNLQEGRGFTIMGAMNNKKGGDFDFATSNEMWRASLDILDFMPLTSADYGGGLIITDWYSDTSSTNDSIKITVRFLSNEVQSNSLKIIVHNKKCKMNENCTIREIDSKIKFELQKTILAKAALIDREAKSSKKK